MTSRKGMNIVKRMGVVVLSVIGLTRTAAGQGPYTLDVQKELIIAGGEAAVFLVSSATKPHTEPLTASDIMNLDRSVNWLDRSATGHYSLSIDHASDVLVAGVITAPVFFLLDGKIRNDFVTLTVMYAEAMSCAVLLPYCVKDFVDRPRPFVYNGGVPLQEKTSLDARRSFFSSHTCTAFASAVFVSEVFGDYYPASAWKPYVWASSLALASLTGVLRYESGMHFPSDIIVGALVGSAIGYAIPALHRETGDGGLSISFTGISGHPKFSLRYAF